METLSEIVAEMRGRGEDGRMDRRLWLDYADRIEAIDSADAWRSLYTPGNAAAIREALENIAGYAETARCHTEDAHVLGYLEQIEKWANEALSAPARQCDVGTAEEGGAS